MQVGGRRDTLRPPVGGLRRVSPAMFVRRVDAVHVHPVTIRRDKLADAPPGWERAVPSLRPGRFVYESAARLSIHGEAPKNFVRAYDPESKHPAAEVRKWPWYIAKVGHKWYPVESVTEHLITRIGQELGVRVAQSRLACIGGQVRFMSRYFLRRQSESLVHGAELFARLLDDRAMVEEIASRRMERSFYTFEMVEEVVGRVYGDEAPRLMQGFVAMLGFDAIVGNNDRHPYNWGVIESVKVGSPARFAPVFDTARGLFWNTPAARVTEFLRNDAALEAYLRGSKPQLGGDRRAVSDHFDLIAYVAHHASSYRDVLASLRHEGFVGRCEAVLTQEFAPLLTPDRRALLHRALALRHARFLAALS